MITINLLYTFFQNPIEMVFGEMLLLVLPSIELYAVFIQVENEIF